MNRRDFLSVGTLAACAGCLSANSAGGGRRMDPHLSVFFSDVHVSVCNYKNRPTYQNHLFAKAVDQVLAMDPLPKNVLIFGDVALWFGIPGDYAESEKQIRRLRDAGIQVTLTTGNHDHREPLFAAHPRQKEITPVPGRLVSVVDLGTADFVLLDTLKENLAGEGAKNAVEGELDAAQGEWLLKYAASAKRPFLCGAHHPPQELAIRGKAFLQELEGFPRFAGYVHGHNHRWYKTWHHFGYVKPKVQRSVCLPSTGWWGDIGFATFRTFADRAELALVQSDFFFPRPLAAGARRPAQWDDILHENAGDVCTFTF